MSSGNRCASSKYDVNLSFIRLLTSGLPGAALFLFISIFRGEALNLCRWSVYHNTTDGKKCIGKEKENERNGVS